MDKNYAKGWNELKTKNSWMLFKIMGEFVEGFEKWVFTIRVSLFLDQPEHLAIMLIINWQ